MTSRLAATADILPAAEANVVLTGYQRMDRLRAETERLHAEMLVLCETERRKSEEAGRRAGAAEGLALLDQAEHAVTELIASLESELGLLALAIAERIIGQFDEREQIGRAVEQAIKDLREGETAALHVAPKYFADIRDRLKRLQPGGSVSVESDAAIGDTGCVLTTARGVIDAGIQRQLDIIRQAMRAQVGRRSPGGDEHDADR